MAAMGMLYPEPEKGGRGKKSNVLDSKEFSAGLLSQARQILAYSQALAVEVMNDISLTGVAT
jgi:hypothetical protein